MSRGRISSSFSLALALVLALVATGCHDDPATGGLVIEGSWIATIAETTDTCDDLVEPVAEVAIRITDEGDQHLLEVANLGTQECWVQPFTITEETLAWSAGQEMAHPCNDGCVVRVDSSATLEFHEGGLFTGTETLTFTPQNDACDHPDCAFPCEAQDRHLIFPPLGDGCAISCETTYSWSGVASVEFLGVCI